MTQTLLTLVMAVEPGQVGSGRIPLGWGWGYVWSAYGITWTGISLYALSLWMRRRSVAATELPRKHIP